MTDQNLTQQIISGISRKASDFKVALPWTTIKQTNFRFQDRPTIAANHTCEQCADLHSARGLPYMSERPIFSLLPFQFPYHGHSYDVRVGQCPRCATLFVAVR